MVTRNDIPIGPWHGNKLREAALANKIQNDHRTRRTSSCVKRDLEECHGPIFEAENRAIRASGGLEYGELPCEQSVAVVRPRPTCTPSNFRVGIRGGCEPYGGPMNSLTANWGIRFVLIF